MKNKFELYSCGLYSSWCFWSEDNVLFDVGEGCSLHLKNRVYAVNSIFLSHNHGDHVLNLPSFVGIRNSARGDKEKPLTIYYPKGEYINGIKTFIEDRNPNLTFDLIWKEIEAGDIIDLGNNRYVRAFKVEHTRNSLGYCIVEKRKRLKARYKGMNIGALIRDGSLSPSDINEEYHKNIFAYTLDSYSFDTSNIHNVDHWVADSTFLKKEDREKNTHMTYEEVCKIANKENVGITYAAHVSPRYSALDFREAVKRKHVVLVGNKSVFKAKYS